MMACCCVFELVRGAVFWAVLLVCVSVLAREGGAGLLRKTLSFFRNLHGVESVIAWLLRREVRGFLRQVDPKTFSGEGGRRIPIPEKGE